MLQRGKQLAGSRLKRMCERLARRTLSGKTLDARVRLLDSRGGDSRVCEWILEEAEKRKIAVSGSTAAKIAAISARATKQRRRYAKPKRDDLAVILCHFNPVGWSRTPKLLYEVCESIVASGVTPVVSQLCLPGRRPASLPRGVRELRFESTSVMFHKENLWNIASRETQEPKLMFLDGDIFFSRRDIFDTVSRLLDSYDVIQPFETAVWLGAEGQVELSRPASCVALFSGEKPRLNKYHPGFSWCMTREFFAKIGGLYERHPLGSGDTALSFSLTEGEIPWPNTRNHVFADTHSYRAYRDTVLGARPRIGYADGVTAYHVWHGDRADRKYGERYKFMPDLENGEYPIHSRPDGILEWSDSAHNDLAREYFVGRKEDG